MHSVFASAADALDAPSLSAFAGQRKPRMFDPTRDTVETIE